MKLKKILPILILCSLYACQETDEVEIIGSWETAGFQEINDNRKQHQRIIGDWKHSKTYISHKDSLDQKEEYFWMNNDLNISENSFIHFLNPCFCKEQFEYEISSDSIYLNKGNIVKNIHYSLFDDTLKFVSVFPKEQDHILFEVYTKANFDNTTIAYLAQHKTDPDCFSYHWACYPSESQEKELSKYYSIREFPLTLELPIYDGRYTYNMRSNRIKIKGDTIELQHEDWAYKMLIKKYFIDNREYRNSRIIVNPIIDGEEIELSLWYQEN